MAVTITVQDVRNCISTGKNDAAIQSFIAVIDTADTCLDANQIPDAIQQVLKTNAVAHMLQLADGGQITSERDQDGASVTVATPKTGSGLSATTYGELVLTMQGADCIRAVIDQPKRFARPINPYGRNTETTQQSIFRSQRNRY